MQDPSLTGVSEVAGPLEQAAAGCVLLAIALVGTPLVLWLTRLVAGPRERVIAGWNVTHAAAVAAVFIAVNILVYAVSAIVAVANHDAVTETAPRAPAPILALFASVAMFGLTGAFAVFQARATSEDPWAALGLRGRGVVRALATVFVLFPYAYLIQAGLLLVWQAALHTFGREDVVQDVARLLGDVPHDQRWIAMIIGAVLMPFLEELVFRGFLLPALERHLRPLAANVVTSLAFGALHGIVPIVPIFGLSLVLGYARQRTGSVWPAFVLHAAHNAAAFVALWYVSKPAGA